MKDIDFDELDRAVNSVLAPNSDTNSDSGDSSTVQEVTVDAPSETTTTPVPPGSAAPSLLVQKRSSGRFMDVVHTSSDMRRPTKPAVSRHGAEVAPLQQTEKADAEEVSVPSAEEKTDPMSGVVADETRAPESPKTPPLASPAGSAYPDPLDFHGFNDSDDSIGGESSTDEASGEEMDDIDMLHQAASELKELDGLMQDTQTMPPLDTPFVNDLAVEKRPLGAFSIGSLEDEKNTSDDKGSTESAMVGEEQEVSLEAEAARFDLALEDALKEDAPRVDDAVVAGVKREADLQIDPEPIPEEYEKEVVAVEAREVMSAAAKGSIPQQYVEKAPVQSTEATPVFDTTDYHQPLKHADKKKSGWGAVLIIGGLILVGAGAGAAFFFLDPLGLL